MTKLFPDTTLAEFIEVHSKWSRSTFGEGKRPGGVTAHLLKELLEVRWSDDPKEWADIIILGVDGLWRSLDGGQGKQSLGALAASVLAAKEERNYTRNFQKPKDLDTPSEAADATGAPRWKPSAAAFDVLAERRKQVEVDGWTHEHDDGHSNGELADAAISYANEGHDLTVFFWPWDEPMVSHGRRADLVRAAALLIAEIERLDRKAIA